MRINKNFNVKGQHITCTDDTRIIKGNKNLYYAVFHVDELWDDIDAKACFTVDEEPYIMPLNRVGNTLECEIPYPANSGIVFGVGIFGGDLISTDIVYTSTTPGIPIDGANPPEPIPDWFNKMEDIAIQAMETANSVKEQADSGAFKGDPFTYDDFTNEQLAGLKGEPGYTPQKGIDYFDGKNGADGKDGADGYTPVKGVDYFDGADGKDGSDGYTPQKGLDYFTDEEVAEIINKAAEAAGRTEETDPTVPAWAKASEKPTYTASEVGARPDTWTPSASDVGADPVGTAASAVSGHNTAEDAHRDIRELIDGITVPTKVSELQNDAGYLTQHQDISGKANTSDLTAHIGNSIVHVTAEERTKWNQAVTDVGNLSEEIADQYAKKSAIPTKVSQLTNDSGYLTQHQDISGKEDKSNKVTSLSASSTDKQYPSAKCVYDTIGNVEALLAAL